MVAQVRCGAREVMLEYSSSYYEPAPSIKEAHLAFTQHVLGQDSEPRLTAGKVRWQNNNVEENQICRAYEVT